MKMGWMGLIAYAKYLLLSTVGNGAYPKKLFSVISAFIAIEIFASSTSFKGLALYMGISLWRVIKNINLWPNYLSMLINMVIYRIDRTKTTT